MSQNVTVKVLILAGLTLVFGVGLLLIGEVVSDREKYRDQVVDDVARSTAKAQSVVGPLLAVPYRERIEVAAERPAGTTGGDPGAKSWREVRGETILYPESLECRTRVQVESRARGIYRTRIYRSTIHLTGTFRVPAGWGLSGGRSPIDDEPVTMLLGLTDMRGLRRPPKLRLAGAETVLTPGTGRPWLGQGLSGSLAPAPAGEPRVVPFDLELELLGTDRLGIVPVGATTRVRMDSDWRHPAFTGSFLPDARTVAAQGFEATWEVSHYATGVPDAIARARQGQGDALAAADFGVRFVEPIDVYRQSQRASKYGLLFVLLTFLAFFLFEVLKQLAVHPIQYGLAGAAVALFFLLLLSLAEYVAFPLAYLAASAACVGLLAFYVAHVLHSATRGLGFAGLLAVLYGVLYLLLQSEDYALLLGTLLLFAVLAAVMIVTRRIDWYRLGDTPSRGPDARPPAGGKEPGPI